MNTVLGNKLSKLVIASGLTIATLNLTGCGDANASAEQTKAEKTVVSIPVEVATASVGDISSHYATTAVLEAKEEAQVVSKLSGIIESIYVEEGDYVNQGQILARIEPDRFILNVNKAKAELAQIKAELNRIEKVHQQNLVSAEKYEKLKWQYESTKSALDIAKLNLKETAIVAPISGYIAQRYVKTGNVVTQHQQESMFHIVQHKQLQGIVHLPEQQLPQVKVGQQTLLNIAAFANTPVEAHIERISPIIDAKTGTFRVTLKIDNPEGTLKAGMFAGVNIKYNTHKDTMLVPRKAVISLDNQHTVYAVENGLAVKKQITVGYQEGAYVEVLEGLEPLSQVVTAGHNNLKNNANVEVIKSI